MPGVTSNPLTRCSCLNKIVSMRSSIPAREVPALVKDIYGLDVVVKAQLDSYADQNFLVLVTSTSPKSDNIPTICPHGYVFKVLNAEESQNADVIAAQTEIILHLAGQGFPTPKPVLNVDENYSKQVQSTNITENDCTQTTSHIVRLFEFKSGKALDKVPLTTQLCYEIGLSAGKLDLTLQTFSVKDEVLRRMKNKWTLQELPKLRSSTHVISSKEQRAVLESILDEFETCLAFNYAYFSKGLIHGDLNECNILVEKLGASDSSKTHINQEQSNIENNNEHERYSLCGIIDFGDSSYSPYICEVAIAIAYVMLNKHEIAVIDAAHHLLKGYMEHMTLAVWELKYLRLFICARFAQSLILGNIAHSNEPENEYILMHVERTWPVLKTIWQLSDDDLSKKIIGPNKGL